MLELSVSGKRDLTSFGTLARATAPDCVISWAQKEKFFHIQIF